MTGVKTFLLVLLSSFLCVFTFSQTSPQILNAADSMNDNHSDTVPLLISTVDDLPQAYRQPAKHPGRVVRVDYATKDYASGKDSACVKPAYIYLPYDYDYDVNKRYPVLYLLHGFQGTAETYLEVEDSLLKHLLDNMHETNEIQSTIVVTPTFCTDNIPGSYEYAAVECAAFHHELLNELIPYVESNYRTYADGTSLDALVRSRAYRAIGGFSLGAVITWHSLAFNVKQFKYFLPMSGDCWTLGAYAGMDYPVRTARFLAKVVRDNGFSANDVMIYAASGTHDFAHEETRDPLKEMMKWPEAFTRDNLSFHEKQYGIHDYWDTMEYIREALILFFPRQSK